jgi:hypothetical protein
MIATTLKYQLLHNIGACEEVIFSFGPRGTTIRRIHGHKELTQVLGGVQLGTMRDELVDGWLGEILWNMALTLRSSGDA